MSEPRLPTPEPPKRPPPPAVARVRCTNCGLIQVARGDGPCRECGNVRFTSA